MTQNTMYPPKRADQFEKFPDSIWIIKNADTLFEFASTKFGIYGTGVVQIDRHNLLKPPRYICATEIRKYKLKNLKRCIEQYNPRNSFILLLESNTSAHPYRVKKFL